MTQTLADEASLVERLRNFDESAFADLVDRYHASLVRLARMHVNNEASAQEVVQETWLAVLRGIGSFEARSSLKTWIYRIAVNRAITRAERDGRMINFSALVDREVEDDAPAVEPERFLPPDHPKWPGHWAARIGHWSDTPENQLLSDETRRVIDIAIEKLPPAQQQVIRLRDLEGFDSPEVCNILGVTETNQRVLLHRARSRVRAALERYFEKSR